MIAHARVVIPDQRPILSVFPCLTTFQVGGATHDVAGIKKLLPNFFGRSHQSRFHGGTVLGELHHQYCINNTCGHGGIQAIDPHVYLSQAFCMAAVISFGTDRSDIRTSGLSGPDEQGQLHDAHCLSDQTGHEAQAAPLHIIIQRATESSRRSIIRKRSCLALKVNGTASPLTITPP